MKARSILAATALLASGGVLLAQGSAKITPGLWESSTEVVDMKVQGLPDNIPPQMLERFKPARTSVRTCITPQQAANPQAEMMAAQKDSNCDVQTMDMTGGKIAIAMTCRPGPGGKADIAMTGRYTPTSYTMDGAMKMAGGEGMTMDMKTRTTGKRIGDCAG